RSDEYTKMLSLAGAHPRDYAILQVFLQTGIRVSELASLKIEDIDFIKPSITVRGKGKQEREIALEKKGVHALKSYLAVRGESFSQRVFLNYQGEPISERGIRKLVVKYRKEAGITKKASCHTFRHTFATCKAEKGVPAYQLQQWLGHANLNTPQIHSTVRAKAKTVVGPFGSIRYSCTLQCSFAKEGSHASPLARRHPIHACGFRSGRQRLWRLWRDSAHLRSSSTPHFYPARACGSGV